MFLKNNYKKLLLISFIAILVSVVFLPGITYADWQSELRKMGGGTGLSGGGSGVGESEAQLTNIIARIIQIGLSLIGIVFFVLLLYGGFVWMMARGREDEITKAKQYIENAVLGLIIVFAAYGISYFVLSQLSSITGGTAGGGGGAGGDIGEVDDIEIPEGWED